MQVDNDWEEGVGKKLFDFEGELSPQAWNNISRQIKPNRNRRYFWLAGLLVFLTLPGTLYFTDSLGWLSDSEQQIAGNTTEISTDKNATVASETVVLQAEKPETNVDPEAENRVENGITSAQKIAEENYEILDETEPRNTAKKPAKLPSSVALIAAKRPEKPAAAKDEMKRTNVKNPDNPSGAPITFAARSGNQHAGLLAFSKAGKKQSDNTLEKSATASAAGVKTVGFRTKKVGNNSITSSAESNSGISSFGNSNAETSFIFPGKIKPEIAALDLISAGLLPPDFNALLPDSLKKYLIATLPEPANAEEENKRKQDKKSSKNRALAVYITPHYTFQRVLPNQNDGVSILKMENRNAFESERFGYEAGFRGYYPVRKNLNLIFGLQAASVKQHLRLQTIGVQPDSVVVTQQGNSISMQVYNTPRNENHLFRYFLGGIFTGMNLRVTEKLDLSGGLGMNWLLQTKTTGEKAAVGGKNFNPYLNLGLQYQQPVSQKLTLTAGPSMQYYLKPMQEKQAFIGVKPTVIGFSVGMKYRP